MFIASENQKYNIFQNTLTLRLKLATKMQLWQSLYISKLKTKDEFENFASNLELNLKYIVNKYPFPIAVPGDFHMEMQG